ncbi:peptide ABC transporter substrate-binding protein [Borrelia sp. RT5S]|uniref:peptide ABC transporter substrate-binding protein n=1 Tax=Borrelia sp. RT5S TaxID=2898581 RepID=UPI001E64ACB6|nr:peptide ABC transporter substrate-binding protein [Borrelia sp. RT5S]UGQ16020.1 peptide ABC transporter substrate-binding protein [Borrelia sp. RT5S]
MKIKQYIFMTLFVISILSCAKEDSKEIISFKISLGGEPRSIDPQISEDAMGAAVIGQMFKGVVDIDAQTGGYKPGLAHSWDISSDGLTYTFYLREGLIWSDGVPITAEGIRKSYIRILNKDTASQYVGMVKSVIKNAQEYFDGLVLDSEVGVKALNDTTLEITLANPRPYFLDMLAHHTYMPVPVHVIEKHGNKWTDPENMVVSGPFKLKEKLVNDKIVIAKNDKYYNASNVEIDEVVFYTINNSTTSYRMYENDELDALTTPTIPSNLIKEIKLRNDYYTSAVNGLYYFSFNTTIKPLDNPKVREALTLAIDRETLTEKVMENSSIPTRGISPNFKNYSYGKELTLFDPQRAKQLLAEAGFPEGKGFPTLKLKYNTNENHKKICEFIQNQWAMILNVNVTLENEEWTTYLASRQNGNYEIARGGWLGDYSDPMAFLGLFQKEFTHFTSYKYFNEEYENLINKSNLEQDPIKRQDILRKAEEIIVEQDFPVAPLYIYAGNYLFNNDKWTGWAPNILERFDFSELRRIK